MTKNRVLFLTTCLFFFATVVMGQNLVPNYSFEEYTRCPGNYARTGEFYITSWYSANSGSPDHFHTCSIGDADVPHNWAGVSEAYHGEGYAGIYTWLAIDNNYREYLGCKLTQPLIKDTLYEVSMQYKLSSYSKYAIDRIGVLITDTVFRRSHDQALKIKPTLHTIKDSSLTPQTGYWESAKYVYRAVGGEQFLTIGNFSSNDTTTGYFIRHRPVQQEMLATGSYYYIDHVKVEAKYRPDSLTQPIPSFAEHTVELDKRYILENIQFDFNSYRLMQASKDELDGVARWLQKHPYHKVIVSGHTDDVGGDQYNLTLSRNRAKTVAAYLTTQRIAPERISSLGFGKTQPLLEGSSDRVRQLNRRVEIKFIR